MRNRVRIQVSHEVLIHIPVGECNDISHYRINSAGSLKSQPDDTFLFFITDRQGFQIKVWHSIINPSAVFGSIQGRFGDVRCLFHVIREQDGKIFHDRVSMTRRALKRIVDPPQIKVIS